MRKLIAATLVAGTLLLTVFTGPAFAAGHPHRQKKANYSYHTPKYKAPKYKTRHAHSRNVRQHKAN